ncbi:MAG: DUF5719 family protein [Acidimicrobiales bacterium]
MQGRRPPLFHRGVSLALVAIAVAGLFTVAARQPNRAAAGTKGPPAATLLPLMNLSTRGASVWDCPGPLVVGSGTVSSVVLDNPGPREVSASIVVAVSAAPTRSGQFGHQLPSVVRQLRVRQGSEQTLVLPGTRGKTVDEAVSVTATGGGIAVSEQTSADKGRSLQRSLCGLGAAMSGALVTAGTSGSSEVRLSIFNPAATPAVADVELAAPSGVALPQSPQGIPIPPQSLVVAKLSRDAVQEQRLAVLVTATAGRISVGEQSDTQTTFRIGLGRGAAVQEAGATFGVGIGRALTHWVLPLGLTGATRTATLEIFNPGVRPAPVVVTSSEAGDRPSSVSLTVQPRSVTSLTAPLPSSRRPPGSSGGATTSVATRSRFTSVVATGTVSVSTELSSGVVVSRQTYQRVSGSRRVVMTSVEALAAGSDTWLLPQFYDARRFDSSVLLTNASNRLATALLTGLPEMGPGATASSVPRQLASVEVPALSSVLVDVSRLVASRKATEFGVEIRTNAPILAEQELTLAGEPASLPVGGAPGAP